MTVSLAQLHCRVGDVPGNCERIVAAAKDCEDDFLLTPEFSICGYPPEDLLAYPSFIETCENAADNLAAELAKVMPESSCAVVGLPRRMEGGLFNVLHVYSGGRLIAEHRKVKLPNYGVFDELRYFSEGEGPTRFHFAGRGCVLGNCHDIWHHDFRRRVREMKPDLVLVSNASPFFIGKQSSREQRTLDIAQDGADVAYVSLVGGQDEHIFDGGSHLVRGSEVVLRAPRFKSSVASLAGGGGSYKDLTEVEEIEAALKMGVRDYVEGAGGGPVFVGVSGGIDSAVVLCIAAAALGPDRVTAVLMPSRYTVWHSISDAKELASHLGVNHTVVDIEGAVSSMRAMLEPELGEDPDSSAFENLQARIRGNILMTLANADGGLVLTTGNKSEMATGYATLYGDMAGAYAVIKDLIKERVYALAAHLNRSKEIIPKRIIERPPTAELSEDQLDSDTLPAYPILDDIIKRIVEGLEEPRKVAEDHGWESIERFIQLLTRSEFKRRQAPIGPTVTPRSFGKDWRMPVSNWHRLGEGEERG